ncbi:hypothetical protein [Mesobacterium pallidum]|uniref:hypothetical protein n=1 Tax=Mesobacterium pallidum TaxID=2872037 RepID=UPI001EE30467|nr:hypothetical protein [Mesobacterium pallidum]
MKTGATIALAAAAAVVIAAGVYMVDIDMTDEGALPDVDVSVEGGELPEFDADVGSIETGTTTETVTVPEVEVDTREAQIEVPTISVNPPEDDS